MAIRNQLVKLVAKPINELYATKRFELREAILNDFRFPAPYWSTPFFWSYFSEEVFENDVSRFVKQLHGNLFVDVGTNFGNYTLLLHNNFENVISVEPHPRTAGILRKILRARGVKNAKVFEYAVTDKAGETVKLYEGSNPGHNSLFQEFEWMLAPGKTKDESSSDFVEVKTTTLDRIIPNGADLVKVDTERSEWVILKGAKPVMDKINSWFIEAHDKSRLDELENLMKGFGYQTKWIDFRHIFAWRPKVKIWIQLPNWMNSN